ncbi:MAG: MASE3 domain-containing protein [Clostridia bacterium]
MFQLSKNKPIIAINRHLLLLAAIIICGYMASHILFAQLWSANYHFIHTTIELFSLFLMIFTFFQVWSTYTETNCFIQWVGFGVLTMVILNLPHLVNFGDVADLPYSLVNSLIDISLKHGVLIAFIEVLIWMMLGFYKRGCTINRWMGILLSLCTGILLLAASISIVKHISDFYSKSNITINKHYADITLALTALYIISIYRTKYTESNDDREKVMYKYIILSMSIFIPARICFAISDAVSSPVQFMGHIFKLAYHVLIYYGIYKTTVEYPYVQVRKVKDFYEKLLDTAPIGIIAFDSEGAISYTNKQCDSLFRYEMRNLCGITVEQLLRFIEPYKFSKLELLEKLYKLKKGTITFYGQTTFSNEPGGKLIFTAMKMPMGMTFAVRDAKKAQAMENMQLQTQTVLDSTDNLVFILDTNRKVVMCNKKFVETINVRNNDIVGLDIMELSRLLQSNLTDSDKININNENIMNGTKWNIRTMKGELKKISLESSSIYDVDNEKIGWIIIGRDVSEYEREQEKILHSEKMAIIGQMAAGLVHEIKNPLASIKGLCQLMRSKVKVEKIESYAAVMENAVDDIGEIVTNFLQFSKPATGDFEKTGINNLINSLEMLISSNAYKHGIKTRFYYSDTEEPVLMSSQHIKNTVLGMVDNAIDAMNAAIDPRLDISTEHDRNSKLMCIAIKDNGMGMTDEQLACIGTPFYTTKPKGTGLGVSAFKYIINEHGGTLKVESKFGEGTAFTIILPCVITE